ncbi:MAG: thioesterase [Desulfobacterales bacterium]
MKRHCILSYSYSVKSHECRPDGRIHLHAMVKYLQETAVSHAEALGCGAAVLKHSHSCWVLYNIKMAVYDFPVYSDVFEVRTWPSLQNRLIAQREFAVSLKDGKKLLKAGSEWLIMHTENRKPMKLTAFDLNIPASAETVFADKLNRLKPLLSGNSVHRFPVLYSSLDANGHVNNTECVRWAVDAHHLISERPRRVRHLQMTYLSEIFEKDEVELVIESHQERGLWDIMGKNETSGKPAFVSRILSFDT